MKRFGIIMVICFISILIISPLQSFAAADGVQEIKASQTVIDAGIHAAKKGNLTQAKQSYDEFNKNWHQYEDSVKKDSTEAYSQIETGMGQVSYALMQKDPQNVLEAFKNLKKINLKYINGGFKSGDTNVSKDVTVPQFVQLVNKAITNTKAHHQKAAQQNIQDIRQSWLSIEGTVVGHSKSIYDKTEADMVTIDAMLNANPPKYDQALPLLKTMQSNLSSIAQTSGYTMWDAAMIPIREGLEALLVISALLAFMKKSNAPRGRTWIGLGVGSGVLVSLILAFIVKFAFAAGTFGNNNFLITGWTGLIAAFMLLYMSYWLHRQSKIKDWNLFIKNKSQKALKKGSFATFGLLAFLAVFREGTETVLFYIGMANQISLQTLLLGLAIGFGILFVLGFLMIFIGMKLPIKPFFAVSSLIVFYLCIKFLGMGIHGLQLADVVPSTHIPDLTHISFFALYPSLESALPQLLVVIAAIIVIVWSRIQMKSNKDMA